MNIKRNMHTSYNFGYLIHIIQNATLMLLSHQRICVNVWRCAYFIKLCVWLVISIPWIVIAIAKVDHGKNSAQIVLERNAHPAERIWRIALPTQNVSISVIHAPPKPGPVEFSLDDQMTVISYSLQLRWRYGIPDYESTNSDRLHHGKNNHSRWLHGKNSPKGNNLPQVLDWAALPIT